MLISMKGWLGENGVEFSPQNTPSHGLHGMARIPHLSHLCSSHVNDIIPKMGERTSRSGGAEHDYKSQKHLCGGGKAS